MASLLLEHPTVTESEASTADQSIKPAQNADVTRLSEPANTSITQSRALRDKPQGCLHQQAHEKLS